MSNLNQVETGEKMLNSNQSETSINVLAASKKEMNMRPTPTKVGFGGLTLTLLNSLIVIGLELKKNTVKHPQELYLQCVSINKIKSEDEKVFKMSFRCHPRLLTQAVIDKTWKSGRYAFQNGDMNLSFTVDVSNLTSDLV